jgi:uncharacterized membrane protein YoaK (UPF0700 family)
MTPREQGVPASLFGLTAVTGLVDAASYLALGHVFIANMTGNVVLLGFAIVGAPGFSVPRSSAALAAFCIGGVIGGRISVRMNSYPQHRWTSTAYAIEAALLLTAMFASLGQQADPSEPSIWLYSVIVLGALAMGIRNATVRKLAVPDMTTTVLTLTITGLAADSSLARGSNPRWQRRITSVLVMFAGAAIGALLLMYSLALVLGMASLISLASAIRAGFERSSLNEGSSLGQRG